MSRTTPRRPGDQIDFIPRQVNQRYAALLANGIGNGLTPTQWVALACLGEIGPYPQNQLGRFIVTDTATIKGVVERLDKRGLIQRSVNPDDGRCPPVSLSPAGCAEPEAGLAAAREINRQALAPLSPQEQEALYGLLTCLIRGHCGLSFLPRYVVRNCAFRRSGLPSIVRRRHP